MDGLGDGGGAVGGDAGVAADAADAVLPGVAVRAVGLALGDEVAELGGAVVVVDLVGRQAGDDAVAVGEEEAGEADGEGERAEVRNQTRGELCVAGLVSMCHVMRGRGCVQTKCGSRMRRSRRLPGLGGLALCHGEGRSKSRRHGGCRGQRSCE